MMLTEKTRQTTKGDEMRWEDVCCVSVVGLAAVEHRRRIGNVNEGEEPAAAAARFATCYSLHAFAHSRASSFDSTHTK